MTGRYYGLRFFRLGVVVPVAALVCACAATSPVATFYELKAVQLAAPRSLDDAAGPGVVGIGPVELALIIDRPQLVITGAGNELQIAEYHRWGGELADNLARVMATNLSWRIGSDQVFALPWSVGLDVDYRVAMNIYRLDGAPGKDAHLVSDWIVLDRNAQPVTPIRKAALTEAVIRDGYPGLVEAFDRLLGRLSDLVARQLDDLRAAPASASDTP